MWKGAQLYNYKEFFEVTYEKKVDKKQISHQHSSYTSYILVTIVSWLFNIHSLFLLWYNIWTSLLHRRIPIKYRYVCLSCLAKQKLSQHLKTCWVGWNKINRVSISFLTENSGSILRDSMESELFTLSLILSWFWFLHVTVHINRKVFHLLKAMLIRTPDWSNTEIS